MVTQEHTGQERCDDVTWSSLFGELKKATAKPERITLGPINFSN